MLETTGVVSLPSRRGTGLGGAQYCNRRKCVVKSTHLSAEHSAVLGGVPHLFSEGKFTLSVPATYFDFYETGGYSDKLLGHQQYAYGMLDIITHYTFPGEDVPDLEAFAAGYQISFSTTAEKCDVYNATFGENQGYLVYAEYSDGSILRAFIFDDNKGNVQYLCVEGVNDEYSDVYKTVFCNYVQP